ncbi:hypothetical protein NDU88_003789 [Pleurodeles waltl]|uniref:Uncharacterized protein n=1 Tax=Pleurodeles waltl TaxID=8319 RepID=A0AAV7VI38_PLEWA|nr:hypothetical protein NDU88_003789 [Pleurodeles waltl]
MTRLRPSGQALSAENESRASRDSSVSWLASTALVQGTTVVRTNCAVCSVFSSCLCAPADPPELPQHGALALDGHLASWPGHAPEKNAFTVRRHNKEWIVYTGMQKMAVCIM